MSRIEYKFSKDQIDLISLGRINTVFNENTDYIRLNVWNAEDDSAEGLLYTFASNRPLLKDENGKYYFGEYHQNFGQYRTGRKYDEEDDEQRELTLIGQSQLKIYFDETDPERSQFFIKPNEILDKAGITQGNYIIKIDSFKNIFDCDLPGCSTELTPFGQSTRLQVKQVAPSRKELRLIITDFTNKDIKFESVRNQFTNLLGNPESDKQIVSEDGTLVSNPDYNPYKFDWALSVLNQGVSIPVLNFMFDDTGKGETTLLLKLNDEIPSGISEFDYVILGKQLSSTVVEEIYFVSTVEQLINPQTLPYDVGILEQIGTDDSTDIFQTYNEITGGMSDSNIIEDILSGSDVNLNIDFGSYDNHVFFGSAVRKLENFKTKVGEIESLYNTISHSLNTHDLHISASNFELGTNILNDDSASFKNYAVDKVGYTDETEISNSYFDFSSGQLTGLLETGSVDEYGNMFLTLRGDGLDSTNRRMVKAFNTNNSLGKGFSTNTKSQSFMVTFDMKSEDSPTTLNPFQKINQFWSGYDEISKPTLSADWQTYQFRGTGGTTADGGGVTIFCVGNTSGSVTSSISIDNISIKPIYNIKNPDSVVNNRKYLFKEVQKKLNEFTPYEKYLYYGTHPTASAPNLGKNATNHRVLKKQNKYQILNNFDGFDTVYKVSMSSDIGDEKSTTLSLFDGVYKVEDAPFFNTTSSLYLSFLMKGDSGLNTYGSNNQLHYKNVQTESVPRLPHDVMDTTTLSQTTMSEYGYRRYIYRASASHWRPVSTIASIGFPGGVDNFSEGSTDIEILQDNNVSGSFPINAAGKYQYLSTVTTGSGHLFSGSMLPAGELFNLKFSDIGTVISSSYLTDVRISDSDPTSVNPFQQVLSTGSADFTNWYGGLKESASLYDTNNIHSLVNNLPAFIITDCDNDHSVMMKFVDMMGEYYDLLRCYIDNYTSFVKPGYSGTDIAPANVLSQLAADKDWEFIMPFTGSLVEHLGGNFSKSETTKDRTDSTFRKVYNSLISIYKSKGSLKGIRSLLNAYGMPPEVLKLREHGGSLDAHDLGILSSDTSNILDGVSLATGSISYEKKFDTLYSYMFNSDPKRTIGLDWHMNSAGITDMSGSSGAECIEFIVKPAESSIPQTILKSSGSANESFWDLRIVPSASADEYGFLEFRLNHSTESYVGHAGTISSSLKTPALGFKTNEFWNVMLFKTSQSYDTDVSQTYYQETSSYYLAVGRGTGDKIRDFNVISMSVDTPLANMAWACTGSHGIGGRTAAENLRVGETLTGSLSEIKLWKTPISFSRFKQHILDPKSSVGNSLLSAQNDLVYHYRLNENWQHDATTPKIFDANPNNGVDYTRNINTSVFDTGSILYDMTDIERTVFGLRTDGNEMANDNNIIINPVEKSIGNLDPKRASKLSQFDTLEKKRTASTVVEIVKSPQDVINDFIINALGDFDINDYFASAQNLEDQEYTELNKLQKDFLDHFDISLDVNKYIRAQAAIFNKSLIESIKKLLPARATLDTVGIELKDTFLNREKLPQPKISQEFTRPEDDIPVIEPIETGEYSDTKTEIIYEQQIESTQGIYETDLDSWRAVPSQESGTLSAEQIQIEALPFDYRVDGVTSNALGTEPYECEVRGDDMKCFPGNQFREPHLDQGISTNKTGSVRFPGPGDANTVTPAGEGQDSYGYETRYIFPTIGDVEVVSASNDVTSGQTPHTDFTGEKHFKNNQTDNTLSPSLGHRPIGTTARFFNSNQASASGIEAYKRGKRLDDTYIYPANHIYIVGSSKDAFDNLFYKGTQNGLDGQGNQEVDGRTMEMDGNTDLSSASFYRVNVTGENILKVNRGEK